MPAITEALQTIAARRQRDPLAPVTVIVPSHLAAIQLRRRLAALGPFAGVRFETLPRLAELLAGGELAASYDGPLARPIGDYVAAQVAREAGSELAGVRELPGFARVLRQTFRRLRRGGFQRAEDVPVPLDSGLLGEVVRLYGLFRQGTAAFYDDEDLLAAAAGCLKERRGGLADELGEVYVLPPGALSDGAGRFLTELRRAVGAANYKTVEDAPSSPETHFVLAPDPSSDAREAVREVVRALEEGCALDEIAVFHGADASYRALLAQAFESADLPVSAMPGTPLHETPTGRAVLALAELPSHAYSRNLVIDCLTLAPLRSHVPSANGDVPARPATWRRLARQAGITRGAGRWQSGLASLQEDYEAALQERDQEDERRGRYETEARSAAELRSLMEELTDRLEPLRQPQPAASFIEAFKQIVAAYLDPAAPALAAVEAQIDQLGTIDAAGGSFSLDSFAGALRANLEASYSRQGSLGDGVLVASYRLASGLSFERVVLCGAYEGAFPPGPAAESLIDDHTWTELQRTHPFVENARLRSETAHADAQRAVNAARRGLTWTAPLQAAGAGRDHYPCQLMLAAAQLRRPSLASAGDLRRAAASEWLSRPPSPLAAMLRGHVAGRDELRLRRSLALRRDAGATGPDEALQPSLTLLRERRSERFTAYDGNLSGLSPDDLVPHSVVSPTALESYAGCGLRYFLAHVLHLRPPDEPEDRDTMEPMEKGSIVHAVLQEFFSEQREQGRPQPNEAWNEDDHARLLAILDSHLDQARARGRTGLDVFAQHERRRLRADMSAFLEQDSAFRAENQSVPREFEIHIPEKEVAGLRLRGVVDRIDYTADGRRAWVIDYKTGRTESYEALGKDPLGGGTKLQLPVYLAAVLDGVAAQPLYWFISAASRFARFPFDPSETNLRRFDATLAAILEGIKRGAFPANPGDENERFGGWTNCGYCDFNRLCSRRRDDEFAHKREDAGVRPWALVAETASGAVL